MNSQTTEMKTKQCQFVYFNGRHCKKDATPMRYEMRFRDHDYTSLCNDHASYVRHELRNKDPTSSVMDINKIADLKSKNKLKPVAYTERDAIRMHALSEVSEYIESELIKLEGRMMTLRDIRAKLIA